MYELSGPLARKTQWEYKGFHQKLGTKDIKRTYPKNPKCKSCKDTGSIWVKQKAGKSTLKDCQCISLK